MSMGPTPVTLARQQAWQEGELAAAELKRQYEARIQELEGERDFFRNVAVTLGDHLADIAELVGLDRNCEDLAVTSRVRQLTEGSS